MTLDRFLVYGEYYHKLRDSLAGAMLSENMDELIASLEVTFAHFSVSLSTSTLMPRI